MKRTYAVFFMLMFLAGSSMAQRVVTDNFDQLKVHYVTPDVTVAEGDYLTLTAEGYMAGGEVGAPMLLVHNSLLAIPFCEGMTVEVTNALYDTLALPVGQVMPLQPAHVKSDRSEPRIVIDETVYATDAFVARPLAEVEPLGVGRDRRYARLTWSPVSINPVSGQMVVCRSADVTVRYLGSDASATMKQYERYYTPAFSLGTTLNRLFTNAKDVRTTAPVRMVIMVPQDLQCAAIDEFADWKRQQGMLVDVVSVANSATPSSNAALLQQLYDEATPTAPAPTYLILVGDVYQLPAFTSDLPSSSQNYLYRYQLDLDHVTDLYFTTWTSGDVLPDCYWGRFSAADTATLRNIIDKTLYYERYQFADDNYLTRAALVSGEDNGYNNDYSDNAWRYADPSMDYVAAQYVNAANGYNTVYYYKNDPDNAPEGVVVTGNSQDYAAGAALRARYNEGLGWINYSAHGDWNKWHKPNFTVSHANQMSNTDKPSFMIGNCCLSNKFDEGTCLGEALLRKGNRAGAVAYIGATNSTIWEQDFDWTVGVRSNVTHTSSIQYNATRKGMYDHLFHTHNEELSQWMVTAGKIMMAGNMSVNSTRGSNMYYTALADYYWEIYELMGDPSLLPWLGRASVLSAVVSEREDGVAVVAAPGAYVAIVRASDHELIASDFANASGNVQLSVPAGITLDEGYLLSITAQGYKPYLKHFNEIDVSIRSAETAGEIVVSPNPANNVAEVRAEGLRRVTLLNTVGQTLQSAVANGDRCRLEVSGMNAGLYLLRVETATGSSVRKLIVR